MFVVIGTVTADIMVQSDTAPIQFGGDGFRADNLVFTDSPPLISMGGNGGNSASVLAGLGAETALCGAVGQDLLADALIGWLEARQVNLTGLMRCSSHATSTSIIIMTDAENQVVFHHLGSSSMANFDAMPPTIFSEADALLISSFPIMSGMRADGFRRALELVHAQGGLTAVDVGPAIGLLPSHEELSPLLPAIDYLIANIHELTEVTGVADWPDAAEQLLRSGARQVVVKQGVEGSTLCTRAGCLHVPAFPVTANISVGAGDAFNAGFLFDLRRGRSGKDALRFGNAVAALVLAGRRGILDAPSCAEVDDFLAEHPAIN